MGVVAVDAYTQVAKQIIKDQENIIGPIALEQARKVEGINVSEDQSVTIVGNARDVLDKLVRQYEKLFGRASIEVCKEALHEVKTTLSPTDLPDILR